MLKSSTTTSGAGGRPARSPGRRLGLADELEPVGAPDQRRSVSRIVGSSSAISTRIGLSASLSGASTSTRLRPPAFARYSAWSASSNSCVGSHGRVAEPGHAGAHRDDAARGMGEAERLDRDAQALGGELGRSSDCSGSSTRNSSPP